MSNEMITKRNNFAAIAMLASGLALPGCAVTTATHTPSDLSRVPKSTIKLIESLPETPTYSNAAAQAQLAHMSYEKALEMAKVYSGLPPMELLLTTPNQSGVIRTSPLNGSLDLLVQGEKEVPQNTQITRLTVGSPDYLSPWNRKPVNQFSDRAGILAIENRYSSLNEQERNPDFSVTITEKTGLKGTKEQSKYFIEIEFSPTIKEGKEPVIARQRRTDPLYVFEVAGDIGISTLVAGPGGAIGAGISNGIFGVGGFIQGDKPARGTNLAKVVEQSRPGYQFRNVLETADRIGADNVIVMPYTIRGEQRVAIVYGSDLTNIQMNGNTITAQTTALGADYLGRNLLGAANTAVRLGSVRAYNNATDNNNGGRNKGNNNGGNGNGEVGGGETGGSGGTGFSGGETGGSGGQ